MSEINRLTAELKEGMPNMFEDADGNGIPDSQEIPNGDASILSEEGINALGNSIDDVVKGLGCGF
jgi:hypothetical protein